MNVLSVMFVAGSVIAAVLAFCALRGSWRLALAIYLGAYILTTVVGSTIISFTDGRPLIEMGLDTQVLQDSNSITYWFLLFMPLLFASAATYFSRRLWGRATQYIGALDASGTGASPMVFSVVVLCLTFYCVCELAFNGLLSSIFAWGMADYVAMISVRSSMFGSLSRVFFGIVYSAMPALSQYALYETVRTKRLSWKLSLGLTICLTCILYMTVVQKSVLLLYLLFLGIGLALLKVVKPRTFCLWLGGMLFLLTFLQTLFSVDWGIESSMDLLVFRMASSFPYYVNIYPDMKPFVGIDFGLHLIGLDSQSRDNLDTFSFMYPSVTWTEGAAAAPAHVKAYAQAGLAYSVVTVLIIGVAVSFVARLWQNIRGPICFTFYLQSLVFLYYCTQTSLRESFVSCYGLIWTVFVLGMLISISKAISHRFGQKDGRILIRHEVGRPGGGQASIAESKVLPGNKT
jgi:hypothetical protein